MKRASIVARVVRGMTLVAILSSLALAGTAALISRVVWRSNEENALAGTASAVTAAIQAEASEEGTPFEEAGPEALKDAALAGFHAEVWSGGRMVYQRPEGDPMGPPSGETGQYRREGWLLQAVDFRDGTTLLVGSPEQGERDALKVFAWSLFLSLPVCLILAAGVGWVVGRRATRPLIEFTKRVAAMRDLEAPGASDAGAITRLWTAGRERERRAEPVEVADLDDAFHRLLERLSQTLRREIEFAANASHELRTPLTNMRLYAEEASREATPEGRRALGEQMREIDRMVRLIDSLLVMARESENGIPIGEAVNMADIVRDVAARHLGGAADVSLPDEAMVRGDEGLLGIAVENLLDNARKFTRDGGTAKVRCDLAGPFVRLIVVSPGARIGESERESLFERFYRSAEARASRSGHGIGLPLARHIARLHGGDVRCLSSPEEDACFTLEVPAWRPEPRTAGPPSA